MQLTTEEITTLQDALPILQKVMDEAEGLGDEMMDPNMDFGDFLSSPSFGTLFEGAAAHEAHGAIQTILMRVEVVEVEDAEA